jgi:hypothetical protein
MMQDTMETRMNNLPRVALMLLVALIFNAMQAADRRRGRTVSVCLLSSKSALMGGRIPYELAAIGIGYAF